MVGRGSEVGVFFMVSCVEVMGVDGKDIEVTVRVFLNRVGDVLELVLSFV